MKLETYESGVPLVDASHKRVSIKFFVIAMVFILFDVEIAFLYPWALVFRSARLAALRRDARRSWRSWSSDTPTSGRKGRSTGEPHAATAIAAAGEPRDVPARGDGPDREDPEALPDQAGGAAAGPLGGAGDLGLDLEGGGRGGRPASWSCPPSHVDGVLTFYTMYNLRPVGRHLLQFCTSISCHLPAPSALVEHCRKRLGIDLEETTQDGKFTLVEVECIAGCDKAPVDDGQRHGTTSRWTRTKLDALLERLRSGGLTWSKVLLARVGKPDSRSIDTYIADGGYAASRRSSTGGMTPEQAHRRGQEGRACAAAAAPASPTGVKWSFVPKDTKGKPIYLLCNADESEPGTFKDRLLMEQDPAPAARGDDPRRLRDRRAARLHLHPRRVLHGARDPERRPSTEAYAKGFLGENILGSGYSLDITVHRGAGRLHLRRGDRPDRSRSRASAASRASSRRSRRSSGVFAAPTIVNNVETLCCVTHIIDRGAEWFPKIGRNEKNTGPKLYCVSGHVKRPGVYEAPMGVHFEGAHLRRRLRPGHPGRQEAQGRHPGRRFGGDADGRRDRGRARSTSTASPRRGSMLGSAAIIVMDEDTCIVDRRHEHPRSSSRTSPAASARRAAKGRPGSTRS